MWKFKHENIWNTHFLIGIPVSIQIYRLDHVKIFRWPALTKKILEQLLICQRKLSGQCKQKDKIWNKK